MPHSPPATPKGESSQKKIRTDQLESGSGTQPQETSTDPAASHSTMPDAATMTEPTGQDNPFTSDVQETAAANSQPRQIDENTDMSTLTDQEIMKLMEGMDQQDVVSKVGRTSSKRFCHTDCS
jgi:hypothetical protein